MSNDAETLELRLMLEEICAQLARFELAAAGATPASVRVDTETPAGPPGAFCDLRVSVEGQPPYYIEVDYFYPGDRVVASLARKFGPGVAGTADASRLIVVLDLAGRGKAAAAALAEEIAAVVRPGLAVEIWDEDALATRVERHFGVAIGAVTPASLISARAAIAQAERRLAFGGTEPMGPSEATLLWHFGLDNARRLLAAAPAPGQVLPPGEYRDVVVLFADLCDFSAYVRDTPDDRVVRACLTAFYAKSRAQILAAGGMCYQFVGDAVIGLFGLPDKPAGYLASAIECARGLSSIGSSVSLEWQRRMDRVQSPGGVHVGLTIGDVQILPLRPFSRSHLAAVSDSINLAARLLNEAGPGEAAISNTYYHKLDARWQARCTELPPVEAKNVGKIRGWRCVLD